MHTSLRFWNLVLKSWLFSLAKTEWAKEPLEAVNIRGNRKQSQWGPAFLRPGRAGVTQLALGSKERGKPFITRLPHQHCLGQEDVKGEGFLWSVKIRTVSTSLECESDSSRSQGRCEAFGCLYKSWEELIGGGRHLCGSRLCLDPAEDLLWASVLKNIWNAEPHCRVSSGVPFRVVSTVALALTMVDWLEPYTHMD